MLIALFLAVFILGESLTGLKIFGILLVLCGPLVVVEVGKKKKEPAKKLAFTPLYAEGYLFAGLSALGYGCSPILIRSAVEGSGPGASLAGGTISYIAASVVVLAVIIATGNLQGVRNVEKQNAKWFMLAGLLVGVSQMLRYLALAVAPVTVVSPIQRLSLIFRMLFGWIMNREHEIFSWRLVAGTMVSLVGAVMLSLSVESVRHGRFCRNGCGRRRRGQRRAEPFVLLSCSGAKSRYW